MDKFKSRKFVINLLLIGTTIYLGHIDGLTDQAAQILMWVAIGYNASQGAVDAIKAKT